jgi:hypothetical protein
MPRPKPRRKNLSSKVPERPIQPGSPLYLMLQRIAREVAQDLINNSSGKEKRRGMPKTHRDSGY